MSATGEVGARAEQERARAAAHAGRPEDRAAALLSPCFFATSAVFFVAALGTAPFVINELQSYFYQARVLALTHMLTLGWISMAMLGVLYRYVPGLTKARIPYPRVAVLQGATFVAGVALLVVSFWMGRWPLTTAAAAVLVGSIVLLCVNLWPLLLATRGGGVAELGIMLATGFLLAAAMLGTMLALDKEHPFLGGSTIGNLAAHAHLAGAGWVGVTICALSFRFLPAFLMPTVQVPKAAWWQVLSLSAAIAVLATALLLRSASVVAATALVALAILAYVGLLGRLVASHRLPIDWTTRHALAGGAALLAATATGSMLAYGGADSEVGARVAASYGVLGLLGWMSNLLIGMSYKLYPGFVAGARAMLGRRTVPVAELAVPPFLQATVFGFHNVGVAAAVGALLADHGPSLLAATELLGAGGLLYAGATLRTLAFTVVDPPPAKSPFRILP